MNQMSLRQIMFLDFLLTKSEKTPLIDALHIALPIVFETQLPLQIDRNNIHILTEYMYYVSKRTVSDGTVQLISGNVLNHRLDFKNAVSLLWSLCDLPPDQCSEELFRKVIRIVLANTDKIRYQDLETLLTKMTYRYSGKFPRYYNRELYEACADRLIGDDLGFEYAIHYMRKTLKTVSW